MVIIQKDDNEWVIKCMHYQVEGVIPRGRSKRTWKEVVRADMRTLKINKEYALVDSE